VVVSGVGGYITPKANPSTWLLKIITKTISHLYSVRISRQCF